MTPVDLQCVLIVQLIGLWMDGLMSFPDYQEAVHELETALWCTPVGKEKLAMAATAEHYGLDIPAGVFEP